MSYLRWSHSVWYVFWEAAKVDKMEDESLAIWYSMDNLPSYTYAQLKNKKVEEVVGQVGAAKHEWKELQKAVDQWLKDVEEDYEKRS